MQRTSPLQTRYASSVYQDMLVVNSPRFGRPTLAHVLAKWRHLGDILREEELRKVLVIGESNESELSITDLFSIGTRLPRMGFAGKQVAMCTPVKVAHSTARMLSDTATNRGVRLEYFTDEKEARKWLSCG